MKLIKLDPTIVYESKYWLEWSDTLSSPIHKKEKKGALYSSRAVGSVEWTSDSSPTPITSTIIFLPSYLEDRLIEHVCFNDYNLFVDKFNSLKLGFELEHL